MLDIRKIKENPDAVKAGLKAKEVDCDAIIDSILEMDVKIRALKTSTEGKTAEKNKLAKENGKLFGMKKGAEKKGEDTSAIDAQIEENKQKSIALDASIADEAELLNIAEERQRKSREENEKREKEAAERAKREAEAKAQENPFPYAQPTDDDQDGNPFTDQ